MIVWQMGTTSQASEEMATITHPHVHSGLEPEYAIQHFSPRTHDWQFWDCAYTRVEADNLLASYKRRHRTQGHEWRLAKITYV